MNTTMQKKDIIDVIKGWVTRILLLACFLELVFFYSSANLYGCVTLVYGWLLVAFCVFKREYIQKYRGFCIIPWIKMLNYPSISTKLS